MIRQFVYEGMMGAFRPMNGSAQEGQKGTSGAEQQAALAAAAMNQQYQLAVNTRWAAIPVTAAGYHPVPSAYPTVIPQTHFWGATAQSPQGGQ